jgi:DNA-binding LytR/AlgR family response regulator
MEIKCLIADDSDLAVKLLVDYLLKIENCVVTKICENGQEVKDFLSREKVDILLLDIQMPFLTGIELLEELEDKPAVIITTSYSDYALDGFRLHVVDYLLKPFLFDRFEQAIERAKEYIQYKSYQKNEHQADQSLHYLFVKSDYKVIKIPFEDILYIEGWKQYVKIYTTGKCIITLERLKKMEELLPAADFVRIHKSFLVALNKISSSNKKVVEIKGKTVPIGNNFKEKLSLTLNKQFNR